VGRKSPVLVLCQEEKKLGKKLRCSFFLFHAEKIRDIEKPLPSVGIKINGDWLGYEANRIRNTPPVSLPLLIPFIYAFTILIIKIIIKKENGV